MRQRTHVSDHASLVPERCGDPFARVVGPVLHGHGPLHHGADAVADPSCRLRLLVPDRGEDPRTSALVTSETERCPNRGNTNRSRLAGQSCACFGLHQPERFCSTATAAASANVGAPLARRLSASGSRPARAILRVHRDPVRDVDEPEPPSRRRGRPRQRRERRHHRVRQGQRHGRSEPAQDRPPRQHLLRNDHAASSFRTEGPATAPTPQPAVRSSTASETADSSRCPSAAAESGSPRPPPPARSGGLPAHRQTPAPFRGHTSAASRSNVVTNSSERPSNTSRSPSTPSKVVRSSIAPEIIAWQLAHTGLARCCTIRSRIDSNSPASLSSLRSGTSGGGGVPSRFSRIHLPRNTGDVRWA